MLFPAYFRFSFTCFVVYMLSNWTFFAINRHGQSIYSGETEEQDGTKGKEALLDEAFHEQL
ncbi:hypothetical protein L6232_23880, partial [Shewanella sp. C31]|nr:hypothetical protein [Shewanella electrica]